MNQTSRSVRLALARRSSSVLLGFSILVFLVAVLFVDSAHQIRGVAAESARLRKEYRDRNRLMDELRTNTFRASAVMRDHTFAPDPTSEGSVEGELYRIRSRNEQILSQYERLIQPGERQSSELLRKLETSYAAGIRAVMAASPSGQQDRVAVLVRTVRPHRRELIALISQINALDRRDAEAGEERIQALQARFQRRVETLSLAALVVSALLAGIVVLRTRFLERQAESIFDDVQTARRDLSLLSNRLVAAQEEERRNLSRELHDQVGQSMTAMLMDLSRLESRLSGVEGCREILDSARKSAEENVARVRDMSLLLRPSMLDELGLVPALRWHAREVSRRSGLKVKMIADEFDEDLPEAYRTCVYRIVQEALHNCVKHSHASESRVVINRDGDVLLVSIQDDGIGFDPAQQKGLGLLGIQERAAHLGGSVAVESSPGHGTVVSVLFPLPVSEPAVSAVGVE